MTKKPKTSKQVSKGSQPKKSGAKGDSRLSKGQKVVVVIFIVIFALSTLAGALAAIAPSQSSSDSTDADQTTEDTTTVASIDEQYEGFVSDLEAKLAENSEDRATLLSLGRYCTTWASSVKDAATTDEETAHASELFDKAIGYYDQYLALEDSNAVRVSRALCQYYKGDVDAARAALEELTASAADYGPAWANLGMIYEEQGDTEAALAAYEKAVEADPDDEYGAKTYAEQRISALESASEETTDDSTDSADATTDDSADAAADSTDSTDDASAQDSSSGDGAGDLASDMSDASGTGI